MSLSPAYFWQVVATAARSETKLQGVPPMLDPRKLLDDLLGSKVPGTESTVRDKAGQAAQMARDNPLAAGALAAVLLGTGTGRKLTGSALKIGGMAAVAGLAYKAYQNYQATATSREPAQQGTPAEQEQVLLPPPALTRPSIPSQAPQGEAEFALVIVRAMIAAARADGHIDDAERSKYRRQAEVSRAWATEAEQFMIAELEASGRSRHAGRVPRRPTRRRSELYTASRIAIEPQDPRRARLSRHARRQPSSCPTRWSITSRRRCPRSKTEQTNSVW
jgi:uncharacterized membrane protein YebE (DUF533 family)